MAEERIIDDEYGRGVKLRKTKDGYVDVTDELAEGESVEGEETAEAEEISFEFPVVDEGEDDEDLVGLSTEEALALKKQKAEAAQRRKAEYEQAVQEGNALLDAGDYEGAEKKFEAALELDELATDASVGYWRAKTENFQNPDVLIEEYLEAGIESLEYDLGYEAAYIVKKEYREVFERRYKELEEEERPLAEEVEGKQIARREVLSARRKKRGIAFAISASALLITLALTVTFGLLITSVADNRYIPWTAAFAGLTVVAFIVFLSTSNKFLNACRIYNKNEKVSSTEAGERLLEIREYKDLYGALLIEECDETEEPSEEEPQE